MPDTTADNILQRCQLKPDGTDKNGQRQYRGNSPFRTGSDSKGFSLTISDCGEHGAYTDHVTGESDSLYKLAAKLGIEPTRCEVGSSKRKYDGLKDYAKQHGVTVDIMAAAGWIESEHQGRPCLIIPTQTGKRYRFTDNEKPSYISPNGYKACWYGLDKAVSMKPSALVICNGECSTLVAQHYGVPAIAKTGGESKLPDNLLAELKSKWQGAIYITLDCDDTGRETAGKIKAQLPDATVIDLQLSDRGDLADFCMLWELGSFTELKRRVDTFSDGAIASQPKSSDKVSVSIQDLATANQKELDDIRAGKVMRIGLLSNIPVLDKKVGSFMPHRMHTILGATGMGKSTLAVSLSVAFMWQSPGLMVSTETSPDLWYKKMAAYMTGVSIDKIIEGNLTRLEADKLEQAHIKLKASQSRVYDGMSPNIGDVIDWVKRWQENINAKWLMVDSISRLGAQGTSGIFERTTKVSNQLQGLARDTGLTVVGTSQVGRKMEDRDKKIPTIHDGKGSGAIEEDSDVVIPLYYHHYYVEKNMVKADNPLNETMPEGKALVYVGKHRYRKATNECIWLQFRGGIGFYEWVNDKPAKPLPPSLQSPTKQDPLKLPRVPVNDIVM